MACLKRRRGRWVLDYRDATGARRWRSFRKRVEGDAALAQVLAEPANPPAAALGVDRNVTLLSYATRWLRVVANTVKPATLRCYEGSIRVHLPAVLGGLPLRAVQRGHLKDLLAAKLQAGLSRNSVRVIHATLRAMLNAAIDDGLIASNPAERLGRALRLTARPVDVDDDAKAMTAEQLDQFLVAAAREEPGYYPLFLTLARTGVRLGEAFALEWSRVDLEARQLRIVQAVSTSSSKREIGTPKSGRARNVDTSLQLVEVLRTCDVRRKVQALAAGAPACEVVFPTSVCTPMDQSRVSKAFRRVLRAGALPLHFHPHSLRHTFAVHLLQKGAPITYVRDQLGHSSIQVTADVYGRWLPTGDKSFVDQLDAPPARGSKTVAIGESVEAPAPASHSLDWSRRTDLNRGPADYEVVKQHQARDSTRQNGADSQPPPPRKRAKKGARGSSAVAATSRKRR